MSGSIPLQSAPPSYLYGEYADDADLQATRDAYNEEANGLFQWLQTTAIADYRNDPVSGVLLDFVAAGLYNMTRNVPIILSGGSARGAFADVALADSPFAGALFTTGSAVILSLTDDQFRRALTWNIYSGDGWTFSTPWLRRRLARFAFSANGFDDQNVADQQAVSIKWTALRTATIVITGAAATIVSILQSGLSSGYLQAPIGYSFNVSAA
jgi:hypothetical protein